MTKDEMRLDYARDRLLVSMVEAIKGLLLEKDHADKLDLFMKLGASLQLFSERLEELYPP